MANANQPSSSDLHNSFRALIERFTEVMPYLVTSTDDRVMSMLLGTRIKRLVSIALQLVPPEHESWSETATATAFATGIQRLEIAVANLERMSALYQDSDVTPTGDVALAEQLLNLSRSDITRLLQNRSVLEDPTIATNFPLLPSPRPDIGGGIPVMEAAPSDDWLPVCKNLVLTLIALAKDASERIKQILQALARVLEAFDQIRDRQTNPTAFDAKHELCYVSVSIGELYIDNKDLDSEWQITVNIDGRPTTPLTAKADTEAASGEWVFTTLIGKQIASFQKGKCGEEVAVKLSFHASGTGGFMGSTAGATSIEREWKRSCPNAQWNQLLTFDVTDGSKKTNITMRPLVVWTCLNPESNGSPQGSHTGKKLQKWF